MLERLSILKKIKARQPDLQILAYNVILRISRANSAEEEKGYWAEYGSRMFRLSTLEHKSELGEADEVETAERDVLRAQIPDPVYNDYLQGRKRNHAVNRAMLDWLEAGVFDYLLLPQDDTADYGWNITEARSLQSLIRLRGLGDRAITYPGADETASLLLARYACRQAGFAPRVLGRATPARVLPGHHRLRRPPDARAAQGTPGPLERFHRSLTRAGRPAALCQRPG